jgi:diphosphomevalonate decarboxylase
MLDKIYTARGSPNIALIKYWGRRDDALNLPNNSSISMTLDDNLNTTTSIIFSDKIKSDAVYINGSRQDSGALMSEKLSFTISIINKMKELAGTKSNFLMVSKNSFPSDVGLASSASGAATLVYVANTALELKLPGKELSKIARQISGSACRSIFGGIVRWDRGLMPDGSDSFAEQIVPKEYWADLIDVIAITSQSKKKVPSSEGHKITVKTSPLYRNRPSFAEDGVKRSIDAIKKKDFDTLAELIMRDSNNMHATMLDSWPPIMYLNDVSREIINAVDGLNKAHGQNVAAYTFDAGPNAHIITLQKHSAEIKEALSKIPGVQNVMVSEMGSGPSISEERLISDEMLAANETA